MCTWAIAWMNVKMKDSDIVEGLILIDVLAIPASIIGDVIIFSTLIGAL